MNKQTIPSLFRKKDYNRIYHSQFIILFYSFIQQSYYQKGIITYSSYIALLKLIGVSRHKFTSSRTTDLLKTFTNTIHLFIYNINNQSVSYLNNLISKNTHKHTSKSKSKSIATGTITTGTITPFNMQFSDNYEYLFSYFVIQYAYFKLHIISFIEMQLLLSLIGITTLQPHNNTLYLLSYIKKHTSFTTLSSSFHNYSFNNNNNNNNNKFDFIQPFAFIPY